MADAHLAGQSLHALLVEHIAHHAIVLPHAQAAIIVCHDASGVLAAVLQGQQGVVQADGAASVPLAPMIAVMPHMTS